MLVQMLLPAHLKGKAAAKYYDFLADYEMNDFVKTVSLELKLFYMEIH